MMYDGRGSSPDARRQTIPSKRCSSCPAMRRTSWLWPEVAVKTLPRASSLLTSRTTAPHGSATAFSLQVELLSGTPDQIVSASASLVAMIKHDAASQEGIRAAGGLRSAVTLLKLSQTAGNQRIANAASRLLLHLARDNPKNQDEIQGLNGIPCLVDVALTFARLGDSPQSPGRELLEMTEAAKSAAVALGLLADRHARAIARAGGIKARNCADRTSSEGPAASSSRAPR